MKASLASATAIALSMSLAAGAAHAEEVAAWRLFVSDHGAPQVTVIDAIGQQQLGRFDIDGPASLYRTGSGQTVFAIQGKAGAVSAISTGISFHDHGDHGDIEVEEARLLDMKLAGAKPAHFVEQQGQIAQWFDGEDQARFTSEQAVLDGNAEVRTAGIGAPHHGVAVPYQNHAVVTIPHPQDPSELPVGARVVDFAGNQVGEDVACPDLHGSAGSGALYALACETGLLLISQESGAPQIQHLPYPASLPEGHATTLIGGKGLQYFLGNYGPDRILVVDPSAGEQGFQLVQLPTRRVHFATDPIRPRFAYVVTEDGQLHKIDVLKAEIAQSLTVTDPYSMDGHWSDPRPRVAVAGDQVVVTDPLNARLHLVDAESFAKAGEIAVDGMPFNIVAVGGAGETHDHD
ncbi:zinc metallochaperone AztD [Geminicoccus roseus]|uniref:zinc metallochaperone AztD n=1 Tax=Geminicoccus roseus TaxID=404900 RepID=UPI0003FE359E|nr:zinc metallochaperone AztD [Geminicoccus roseus]